MSSSSDQYLEAGFDPQGLKMSAIRNILNKHSVDFPSNAKKSELLGILQRGVLDQASKLRKEAKKQKRVKADGRDIEVVPAGVSAIGDRTRARTPKAAERTRPALVKRDTKDEIVKAAPAAAEPIAKVPAAAPIAKAPAAVPIARAPVTPIAKAKTISKAPVTPVSKAASVSKGPPTPLSRPLLPTIAKGPSTPISKAPSTPIAKAAVAPAAAAARAPTAAVKVSSKSTTKVASASDAVDKIKRKSKKIKREQLAAAAAAATESPPPKSTMDKAVAVKAGAKRKLSDAEATEGGKGAVDSGDEDFYTPAKARINEAQRQRMAAQRGAAAAAAADDKPRKHVTAHATKDRAKAAAAGNFSDENPFQSSPETARKRRRKAAGATQAAAEGAPVTPLGALRKSQVSDLSFKVALPRAAPAAAPAPAPEAVEGMDLDLDLDQHEDLAEAELLPQPHVGDLVAQFQQEQQAEVAELPARDLSGPPKFSLAPPLASAPSARFTMTPDALRQLASSSSHQAPPPVQPPHHRRATTNQIHRLPPVAPRIAVAPRNPTAPRIAQAAVDSDGDSDGDLQRRRVATLRQHVEGAREGRHSRRSSVASTISEARGATGIPSRAMARGGSPAQFKRRRRGGGTLRAVASWVGVAAAALAAWRTHEQWALGFGNARAELAFQAPPAGSVLAVPDAPPPAGSAVGDQIRYWAQYARAAVVGEPLSCPEHAECAPFVPLHAWRAAVPGPRDQWVVAAANQQQRAVAVQCDAGHVISFPALAPRWVPRVPACVRDASAELRVRVLADALVAECAAHRGRVQCAGSVADHARALLARWVGSSAGSADSAQLDEADEVERLGVSVADLRSAVRPLVVADDFDALFVRAVDELARERGDDVSHVVVEYEDDGDGAETAYFVARTAAMPLGCRARTVAVEAVLGNLPSVLGAVGLAVVALVVSRRVAARRAERRAADVLVGAALRRLKRQARRHYLDPALSPAPGIPSLQLRDLLLLAGGGAGPGSQPETPEDGGASAPAVYYDPRARAGVWDRVRAVVERSANVRCRTTAVRGEPMRVWEWIGPLEDDDDDDLGSFSAFTTPFASPQRMLSSPQGPL